MHYQFYFLISAVQNLLLIQYFEIQKELKICLRLNASLQLFLNLTQYIGKLSNVTIELIHFINRSKDFTCGKLKLNKFKEIFIN